LSHTKDDVSLLQIYDWLDSLVIAHPGVVTPIVGGVSDQRREIRGVKVSFRPDNPVVIFEGGMSSYPTIYSVILN
jgi:carboxypeptidase A